ncbi:NifB/NifX family molybdenum-iron cluster-binding protein [Vibrio salinus]|uniref:NifB/NifX family molybdenum-iron cluster-binding protein n=1 Tax=Vibrio salinus TaxID=2899784 RepID=UPI001E358081|nr:NifB/NifX family molybdenum-iron cluster-binding protein [Vibrio salinus]MCE0492582.1 hypothetical protein [Vibrio salinus]
MITAVPVMDNRLSNHFTKAHHFIFVKDTGELVSSAPNPALDSGCSGKSRLLEMLKSNHAKRVLVKNIGSRMLSRLFECEIKVIMAEKGQSADLLSLLRGENVTTLVDLSRARISKKYEDKKAAGQLCCHSGKNHSGKNHSGHSCCHSDNHSQSDNKKKCCCRK